jgi:hypothetical protein
LFIFFRQKAGRVLWELGYSNQACEIPQVGTFVVEADKSVVLGIITTAERLESLVITGCFVY